MQRETNIPLTIVVAMAQNNAIGKENELPWRLKEDLKFFKKVTMGKPIIMGRKTYDSIGKALPGRDNIVITRSNEFTAPDITVAGDLEDAIKIAEAFAIAREVDEICIIGGGQIYAQALDFASRLYLTEVDTVIEDADAFFPAFNRADWVEEEMMRTDKGPDANFAARMLLLTRS